MKSPSRRAPRPVPHQRADNAPRLTRRFGVTFLVLSLLTTLWSLASPLMSVPDEPAHTIKAAAVARGQFLGTSGETQGEVLNVVVPKYIADVPELACYRFKVNVTADCAPRLNPDDRYPAVAGTSAGNYNPLYYLVVGMGSRGISGEPAIYAMRILSGLLTSLFLAATVLAATQFTRRKWPFVAAGVAITPMVLYLSGAVNPNALEIVTASAVFMNLALVLDNARDLGRVRFNIVAVGVAAAVLANTRALSLLWLALAVIAALLMFPPKDLLLIARNKLVLGMTGLIAIAAAAGLVWLQRSNTLASLLGVPNTITPEQAFGTMVYRTFDFAAAYVAQLGWLDTNGPNGVYVWWSFLMVALMVMAITVQGLRIRLGFIVLFVAALAIPPILQSQVINELGYIWQGRYILPVIVPMLLAAGVALRFRDLPDSPFARRLAGWVIGLSIAAHTTVFANALRRYGVGIFDEANWGDMFGAAKWEPPLGWLALTAAYLVVTAVAGVLFHRHLFTPDATAADGGTHGPSSVSAPAPGPA
ncbi:DUF2142 domain-containing protein [Arthrobacter sp. PAMC25284]|uniref:DUF2142 domain-containing protein n=1 Tax=Arthrobacter sp. PAMC25284 TaxID=2861279 RepID=UPI001C629D19|nr:DUF2142 domain-containing protein [Arthrobacter sp. PAMC25284]QYF89701.1 DUF2142 domain-containing protein [Arthrobacter sp. PAMC25284]